MYGVWICVVGLCCVICVCECVWPKADDSGYVLVCHVICVSQWGRACMGVNECRVGLELREPDRTPHSSSTCITAHRPPGAGPCVTP